MAELEGAGKIVKLPYIEQDAKVDYTLDITEFDAAGKKSTLCVPIPRDDKWGNMMLQAAILKKTTWQTFDIPTIIHAIIYSEKMGLDIFAGDTYIADGGRISTTAGAKIRHAMGTGRIAGYNVEITEGKDIEIEYDTKGQKQVWKGKDLAAKVTVSVRDWHAPVVYETSLREWFVGRNPNWRSRPAYMLRRNALSKALEEVAPLGVDADEAPPAEGRESLATAKG